MIQYLHPKRSSGVFPSLGTGTRAFPGRSELRAINPKASKCKSQICQSSPECQPKHTQLGVHGLLTTKLRVLQNPEFVRVTRSRPRAAGPLEVPQQVGQHLRRRRAAQYLGAGPGELRTPSKHKGNPEALGASRFFLLLVFGDL